MAAPIKRLGLDASFAADGFKEMALNALCAICHDFIEDAVETDCPARHVFCRPCVQECLDRRQPCPSCRGHISKLTVANTMIRNLVAVSKWKCLNFESGCAFTGTKTELQRHLDEECPEQETECPFKGCTEKNRRALLVEHKKTCNFRLIPCAHCEKSVAFFATDNHLKVCKSFPVDCPNGCGEKPPRGELSHHLNAECAEGSVRCSVHGCGETRKRKEMGEHEEEAAKKHVRLLAAENANLQQSVRQLDRQVKELQKESSEDTATVTVRLRDFESRSANIERGVFLESATFSFQGGRFFLRVFPKGDDDSDPEEPQASMWLYTENDFRGQLGFMVTVETELVPVSEGDPSHYHDWEGNPMTGFGWSNFCDSELLLDAAEETDGGALELTVRLAALRSRKIFAGDKDGGSA
uniref:RING-type domain-containing protein n=1 Tax=Chromera velia CCMP2878 TaxID=1169474 RepID=A0A0G4F2P9_9ALVE|eukprot:Cvel_14844.t1-p1 / transcript=Cvel_14844.t1 / gene=Cvel_14844 / organism=Chromera_velia_CCMP2878 / gene_product=TNF receptor-associated factor 5, putative / transcript_product=TNF receptor-associated factor 5, putative / location=Cvel_scaffold1072:31523-33333(-) / protein_length=410 / sequence_SO=supercontig / SO=protein_coding / is_pseudo=false